MTRKKSAPRAKGDPRETLASYGKRGDRVRLLVDPTRDRLEVLYREGGAKKKRVFANTPEGRAEAEVWAETFYLRRAELAADALKPKEEKKRPLTVAELWEKYTASPAYQLDIGAKTRINYRDRWRHWVLYVKPEHVAEETTLDTIDSFRIAAAATGIVQNSIRNTLAVVRVVYNWATTRKLLVHNEVAVFRWKQPAGVEVFEPAEYSEEEFNAMLRASFPVNALTWRVWVALMIAGHHGQRDRAIRHLRVEDFDFEEGVLRWPAMYQKQKKELVHPITWELYSAYLAAMYWRAKSGYTGPWLLFAGGGAKKLGSPLHGNNRSSRRERSEEQDTPFTYGGLWRAIHKAEIRAKVTHQPYRSIHGFRKMAAGNVADRTNDARLGMEWIGDKDPKQMNKYLKKRSDRMDRAGAAAGATSESGGSGGTGLRTLESTGEGIMVKQSAPETEPMSAPEAAREEA